LDDGYCYPLGIGLPSVAQPPLPLQEFLPLQPLSLDLQPPLPLQEFWPLQACFSLTFLSAVASPLAWAPGEAKALVTRFEAWMLALPASKPARAAPVSRNLFDFVIFPNILLNEINCTCIGYSFYPKLVEPQASPWRDREICERVVSPGLGWGLTAPLRYAG